MNVKLSVLLVGGQKAMRRDARSPLTAFIFNNLCGAYALPDRAQYLAYMSAELRILIAEGDTLEMLLDGESVGKSTVGDLHPFHITDQQCREVKTRHQIA